MRRNHTPYLPPTALLVAVIPRAIVVRSLFVPLVEIDANCRTSEVTTASFLSFLRSCGQLIGSSELTAALNLDD